MRRSRKKNWKLVRTEDLEEITDLFGMEFYTKAIEPIGKAFRFLEKYRANQVIPDPSVPRITLREVTLQTILGLFRNKLGPKDYDKTLIDAGIEIGTSFANDLMRFLKENYLLPQDEVILLDIWTLLDTNAGWGNFKATFFESHNKIKLEVENCFLGRGLTRDKTRHICFLKGYIFGVIWELLKQYPRIFREEFRVERKYMEPILPISTETKDNTWIFTINLKSEELKDAFSYLHKAIQGFQIEDYSITYLNTRLALESAFKQKIGLKMNEKMHLPDVLKSYKSHKISLKYQIAKDVYGRSSKRMHPHETEEMEKEKVENLLLDTISILRELELLDINDNTQTKIRESCRKG
jgi:hypothetical protein